jgi:Tfp pilus assembly protein PilO
VTPRDPQRVDALGRWALAGILLAFVALTARQVVRPLAAAQRDLRGIRNAVQILNRARGSLDQLNQEIQLASEEIAAGEALLPPTLNLDEFLLRAESAARQSHTRVEAVTPGDRVEHPMFRELRVDMRVTGTCLALYDFLMRLEAGGQLTRVRQMRMVGPDPDGRCAAELGLALYFSPEGGTES